MKRLICLTVAAAFLLVPVALASAQGEFDEDGDKRRVYYKPVTEIDINEAAAIEGVLQRPGMTFVRVHDDKIWNPLVKLRVDFNPEIVRSVDQIE